MNEKAVNPPAAQKNALQTASTLTGFQGFEPLHSNYVYCPNQFFDVCLKSNSRGMVRIVAYILRQTLGWLDENGEPIHQTVKVSYRDLIEKAGVSRGAIADALQRAVALGFLECHQTGKAKGRNSSGQTAAYTLRWDFRSEYQRSLSEFTGFFAGEGNRTPVPNAYFDTVIPNQSLAVTKVVGAVIRNSIGYQNQFGHRKQHVSLSYSNLQKHTGLSDRSTLSAAIKESLKAGFIACLDAGIFDPNHEVQSATNYGIRWLNRNENQDIGSKTRPEKNALEDRFKNQTRYGSKTRPEDRFKNQTSIKKTLINTISKQQAVVEFEATVKALLEAGFQKNVARELVQEKGIQVVQRQLQWIDARKPENRIAMLRAAIEQNWDEPERSKQQGKRERTRQKQIQQTVELLQADEAISITKKRRIERKQRLLQEWGSASIEERRAWISAAAKRQSAEILRTILAKQSPETTTPAFQILDELALAKHLPPITEQESFVDREKASPVHGNGSPQKENR